ncbi:hypothetical protein LQ757_11540 [Agromyces sp. SYSU K20354]|uniref:hypothetical protein n=1 Tax=Agromyces cavernae TaxID=2898659 RepID=UPI001E399CC5|nr:hypothetical protein [Agromyces cavernae]MCD2442904.1 hypothetical protein [Agromyces cavernae]
MRRILGLRIVRWELKLLYVAVAYGIGYPIRALLFAAGAAPFVPGLVDATVTIGAFVLGARWFRGAGEAVAPPRPWWRMTAWPTLSKNLGILFAFMAVSFVFLAVRAVGAVEMFSVVDSIIGALQFAVLAFLYLNSAVRLTRGGFAKPERLRPPPRLRL